MRRLAPLLALLLAAGCLGAPASEAPGRDEAAQPFALAPPERLAFTMSDGVVLDAVAWRPEGLARAPVVLHATPYASVCTPHAPDAPYPKPCAPELADEFWLDEYHGLPRALVASGYTWLELSVRGTGASGGCFVYLSERERKDLGEVLDQLAAPESTDGIAMLGLSYMSITAVEAMIERPGLLKAVVIGGVSLDEYTYFHTPQGAASVGGGIGWLGWYSAVAGVPFTSPRGTEAYAKRACPETATVTLLPLDHALDERPREHYLERRYLDRLRGHATGVLVLQGLLDRGAGQQVEPLWPALEGTPRALVLGHWEHHFPDDALLQGSGLGWPELPLAWLDHHLRGGPAPDLLGEVRAHVEGDAWGTYEAWPPGPQEALYLGATLGREPASGGLSFRLAPGARACDDAPGTWAVALSEPLAADALLVGNPMAWLEVTSTSASATVAVDLWDVPGDDVCEAALLSYGAADLRFRDDPFVGRDVPVGQTLGTRIDMHAVASLVPAGHRLAVTLSSAGEHGAAGRPGVGTIALGGGSHILLPTASGVGAPLPGIAYPPRPLDADWRG